MGLPNLDETRDEDPGGLCRTTASLPRLDTTEKTQVLFLDNQEIAYSVNIGHYLNVASKHHANPVLKWGPPGDWDELQAYNYGKILYDEEEGVFKNWYFGKHGGDRYWMGIGYAASRDGIHWEKPALGLHEWNGSRQNNIVLVCQSLNCLIKDDMERDPARRYKGLLHKGGKNFAVFSPDGIHWDLDHLCVAWDWRDYDGKMTAPLFEAHSLMRDEADPERRFKTYGQAATGMGLGPVDEYAPYELGVEKGPRMGGMAYSGDFINWTQPSENPILDPADGWEREIHIMTCWKRHGYYIAFYEPTHPHPETRWFTPDIRLAVSRDGIHFHRVCDQTAFIPSGEGDAWDAFLTTADAHLVVGDEIWIYYCGFDKSINYLDKQRYADPPTYQRGTGLAVVKLDQFAYFQLPPGARKVPTAQGHVNTIPIEVLEPARHGLVVNVAGVDRNGSLSAELADPETGGALEDFGWSDLVVCDGTSQPVTWGGRWDLGRLKLPKVKIYFHLRGPHTRFYGFGFKKV